MISQSPFWISLAAAAWLVADGPAGAALGTLAVTIEDLTAGHRFPDRAAFCPPAGSPEKDVSPGVTWSPGPPATRSYALLMTDGDVPADLGLINKPGVTIARDAPRMRVFHWVLADIPAAITALPAGAEGDGLRPGGKPIGPTGHGLRGANVFTTFLAGVKGMAGTYGGYDGPCPPANDERPHRYVVRVVALDVPTLALSGPSPEPTWRRPCTATSSRPARPRGSTPSAWTPDVVARLSSEPVNQ